ncbi:MAG TPA: hypothetical protein VJT67_07620 [Longimicrobiaceae bacterium]|nr:hypothetical protein [Longimicrobiaceae bacterium]
MTLPRPRLLSAVLPLLLSLAAASCAEPLAPPPPGRFLFEVEYVNFAWGFSYHGFVVDEEGHVYSYDLADTRQPPPSGDEFTAAELEAKYAHRRALAGSVAAAEVQARYARVGDALAGSLTPEQGMCADAGTTRYTALLYDAPTGTYHRLLLHQNGDVARTNTSPAARELFRWLAEVTTPGIAHTACDPFAG